MSDLAIAWSNFETKGAEEAARRLDAISARADSETMQDAIEAPLSGWILWRPEIG